MCTHTRIDRYVYICVYVYTHVHTYAHLVCICMVILADCMTECVRVAKILLKTPVVEKQLPNEATAKGSW